MRRNPVGRAGRDNGFVKYTVSRAQISAQYVGTCGGSFTDAFTITLAPPAAPTGLRVR